MPRKNFLTRTENISTTANYKKSFKKFDNFLSEQNQTEESFIQSLTDLPQHEKYNTLQKLVNSIKKNVSPRTTRQYFDNLFIYFLLEGAPLDYTQKRIRLTFPRIMIKEFTGLDEDNVRKLLSCGSINFQTYMSVLIGAGLRETEGLLLEPQMIHFHEHPTRIELSEKITKYNIRRETFLPPKNSTKLKDLIEHKQIKDNQTIFTKNFSRNTLKEFEQQFAVIRTRCKLDTSNREKHQQNDITLHSFRSYFITIITDLCNEAVAGALAGHSRYMKTYYRKPLKKRGIEYAMIMDALEF